MRTTLTIDDDVAAVLGRLLRARKVTLKKLVNDALRRGLSQMDAPQHRTRPFRTRTYDGGKPLVDNVDNVAEVLAIAEGEDYK